MEERLRIIIEAVDKYTRVLEDFNQHIQQLTDYSKRTAQSMEELSKQLKNVATHGRPAESTFKKLVWTVVRAEIVYRGFMRIIRAVSDGIRGMVEMVDRYRMTLIEIAALKTTQVAAFLPREEIEAYYQRAKERAGELYKQLLLISAETPLTTQQVTRLYEIMAVYGQRLDLTSKKAREGVVALANAIAILTRGQRVNLQLMQEVRAMMTGVGTQYSELYRLIVQTNPELKEQIRLWAQQGELWLHLSDLLPGFVLGGKEMLNTWQGLKTTLRSVTEFVLRPAFEPFYKYWIQAIKDFIAQFVEVDKLTGRFTGRLTEKGKQLQETVKTFLKDLTTYIDTTIKGLKIVSSLINKIYNLLIKPIPSKSVLTSIAGLFLLFSGHPVMGLGLLGITAPYAIGKHLLTKIPEIPFKERFEAYNELLSGIIKTNEQFKEQISGEDVLDWFVSLVKKGIEKGKEYLDKSWTDYISDLAEKARKVKRLVDTQIAPEIERIYSKIHPEEVYREQIKTYQDYYDQLEQLTKDWTEKYHTLLRIAEAKGSKDLKRMALGIKVKLLPEFKRIRSEIPEVIKYLQEQIRELTVVKPLREKYIPQLKALMEEIRNHFRKGFVDEETIADYRKRIQKLLSILKEVLKPDEYKRYLDFLPNLIASQEKKIESYTRRAKNFLDKFEIRIKQGAFGFEGRRQLEMTRQSWQNLLDTIKDFLPPDKLDAFKKRFEELYNQANSTFSDVTAAARTAAQQMQQAFSDFFFDVMRGKLESFEDLLGRIVEIIQKQMARLLAQTLSTKIFGAGGFGGWFTGLIGKIFGKAEGGILPGTFYPIKRFQYGGLVNKPTFGFLGEGGPEAVIPLKKGKIPLEIKGKEKVQVNLTQINVIDEETLARALASSAGEQIIINHIGNNAKTVRQLILET